MPNKSQLLYRQWSDLNDNISRDDAVPKLHKRLGRQLTCQLVRDTFCSALAEMPFLTWFSKGMESRTFLQACLVICLVVLVAEGEKYDTVVSEIYD